MISAVLELNGDGSLKGFVVKGHSGSAPKGRDVVCAAVSAIVQTALIGLDEVADVKNTYDISDGYVRCGLPQEVNRDNFDKAQTIISTMWLGLTSIAQQYPDFVRIK